MDLTLSGRLSMGVPYQGKLYFDYSVHILTLGGECHALEQIAELNLPAESVKAQDNMLVELAFLAQQLTILGIPQEVLTPTFLLDHLATDDYLLVTAQITELRKKRHAVGESPETTAAAQ
ncbi:hypothetical protein A4G19_03765 [Pasteurellaceae bacterium Macca]|nr:hypothetical protein [Pasteurellaceae bacterium Macca]